MKKKCILLLVNIAFLFCLANAQRIDKQEVFVATSEKEVYKFYNQMLDSKRLSNRFIHNDDSTEPFGFGYFYEFESRDTLMKFVQSCEEKFHGDYICDRFYWSYISNCMPIDFYEHFLNYLKELDIIENYYLKSKINGQLMPIMDIIIEQYESGQLNKEESKKAHRLIEETFLRIVNDNHNYRLLIDYDNYITDKIRNDLVHIIENPFYPTAYLDFYMSQQDTACLDTVGIPPNIFPRRKAHFTPEEKEIYDKEISLYRRLEKFRGYERVGRIEYNGLSAGQAYLQRKREWFSAKGYLPINEIAKYAYQKQDKLLIKHLKEFKKKYPDYPLEYF